MSATNTVSDEELVAYSDGALETAGANEIDAALEQDESLAARLGALDFDKAAVFAVF